MGTSPKHHIIKQVCASRGTRCGPPFGFVQLNSSALPFPKIWVNTSLLLIQEYFLGHKEYEILVLWFTDYSYFLVTCSYICSFKGEHSTLLILKIIQNVSVIRSVRSIFTEIFSCVGVQYYNTLSLNKCFIMQPVGRYLCENYSSLKNIFDVVNT
jgi:hypothetical protein